MKKKEPPFYTEMMKKLEEKGGIIERDIHRGDIGRAKDEVRLSGEFEKLRPENVKQVIEEQRQIEKDMLAQKQAEKKLAGKKPVGKITKVANEAYKKAADFKPSGKGRGGRFGLIATALGLGTSLLAPESKAAEIVNAISEAAAKADPATYLQEGITDFDKKFKELQDQAARKKLEENLMKKEVKDMVREVGGEPDMRPEKAIKLTGEVESPDVEEMNNAVNYEDYLKKKKRQFGY